LREGILRVQRALLAYTKEGILPVEQKYRASTQKKLLSSQSQVFPTSFLVPTHNYNTTNHIY